MQTLDTTSTRPQATAPFSPSQAPFSPCQAGAKAAAAPAHGSPHEQDPRAAAADVQPAEVRGFPRASCLCRKTAARTDGYMETSQLQKRGIQSFNLLPCLGQSFSLHSNGANIQLLVLLPPLSALSLFLKQAAQGMWAPLPPRSCTQTARR